MTPRFNCQWYQEIFEKFPKIVADAEREGLDKVAGRFGLYTGASSIPGALPNYVLDAVVAANREPLLPVRRVEDDPGRITRPIDQYHEIMVEAFDEMKPKRFRGRLIIRKSYHMGGLELNYQQTWDDGERGIPIFTLEDLYANTNPLLLATEAMGVEPATIYNCNMLLTPGLGTLRADGELNVEYATLAAKALVKSVEIVCEHAGLGD